LSSPLIAAAEYVDQPQTSKGARKGRLDLVVLLRCYHAAA